MVKRELMLKVISFKQWLTVTMSFSMTVVIAIFADFPIANDLVIFGF